jgi:hypothetical protein
MGPLHSGSARAGSIRQHLFDTANTGRQRAAFRPIFRQQQFVAQRFDHQAVIGAHAQQHFAGQRIVVALDNECLAVAFFAAGQVIPAYLYRSLGRQHGIDALVAMGQPAVRASDEYVAAAVAPCQRELRITVAAQRKTFATVVERFSLRQWRQAQRAATGFMVHRALRAGGNAAGVRRGPACAQQAPVFCFGTGAVNAGPVQWRRAIQDEIGLGQDFLSGTVMDRVGAFDGFAAWGAVLGAAVRWLVGLGFLGLLGFAAIMAILVATTLVGWLGRFFFRGRGGRPGLAFPARQ